jgi:tetratricopeptide (TPR) repeat protein
MFVHTAAVVAAALSVIVPARFAPVPVVNDHEACLVEHGADALAACERVMRDGRYRLRDLADAYVNRGQVHYVKHEYDLAVANFDQSIRLDPSFALAFGNRANVWSMKKDYDHAIEDYTRAISLDEQFPSAYTGRGLAYEELGDLASARKDYLAAMAAPLKYQDGAWAKQVAADRIAKFNSRMAATADATSGLVKK